MRQIDYITPHKRYREQYHGFDDNTLRYLLLQLFAF